MVYRDLAFHQLWMYVGTWLDAVQKSTGNAGGDSRKQL